jgi:hypothetical protein
LSKVSRLVVELRNWETSDEQKVMKMSPLAGKPAEPGMLVNVPRLIPACYNDALEEQT